MRVLGEHGRRDLRVLEFGCGPTVHRAMAAAPYARSITFADLLATNLAAVDRWIQRDPSAFDWSPFAHFIMQLEARSGQSRVEASSREDSTRSLVTSLRVADALTRDPLGSEGRRAYDLVIAGYCLEAIGPRDEDFRSGLAHVLDLVSANGLAVVMSLANCRRYRLNGRYVDCYPVGAKDLRRGFNEAGFGRISIETRRLQDHTQQGYSAIHLSWARRDDDHSGDRID